MKIISAAAEAIAKRERGMDVDIAIVVLFAGEASFEIGRVDKGSEALVGETFDGESFLLD